MEDGIMNRVLITLAIIAAFTAGLMCAGPGRTLSSDFNSFAEQQMQAGPCDHPGCRVGRDLPKARNTSPTWANERHTSGVNAEEITLDSYHELS
jgi:hypothetical protein